MRGIEPNSQGENYNFLSNVVKNLIYSLLQNQQILSTLFDRAD